jgi:hypothetical protein
MDDLCLKIQKLDKEEKFNDLLVLFKTKTKSLNNDEIDFIYEFSLAKKVLPLGLLILNYRIKTIKRIPMNFWDK